MPEELSCWRAGRAAVHNDRDLQRSLSSNEGSVLSEEDIPADMAAKRQKSAEKCSRGCPAVLQNLAKTYQSVGRHCWLIIYLILRNTVFIYITMHLNNICDMQKRPVLSEIHTVKNHHKSPLRSAACSRNSLER